MTQNPEPRTQNDYPDAPRVSSLFIIPPTLFLVGILLFVALLNRQRELIVLSLLVLSIAGGAKLWARLGRSAIACQATVDRRRVFPGEIVTLMLEAQNRRLLPVSLRVAVPVGGLAGPTGKPAVTGEAALLWYQTVAFRWELAAARRGVHLLGPHRLTAGDLLGFFSSAGSPGAAVPVVVYPRIVPLRPFPVPRRDCFGIPGAESPITDPAYILGTREYQAGRPAKHIHWKASARHHRLQEKLFEPTEQQKVLLAVDVDGFGSQQAGGEFERTLEAVASLAVDLERAGAALGLVANGAVIGGGSRLVPVGRGPQQLPSILELLARLTMEPAAPLLDVLRAGVPLPWGVSCLGFGLEAAGGTLAALAYVARRRVPVTLFVSRARAGREGAGGPADVQPLDAILLEGAAG